MSDCYAVILCRALASRWRNVLFLMGIFSLVRDGHFLFHLSTASTGSFYSFTAFTLRIKRNRSEKLSEFGFCAGIPISPWVASLGSCLFTTLLCYVSVFAYSFLSVSGEHREAALTRQAKTPIPEVAPGIIVIKPRRIICLIPNPFSHQVLRSINVGVRRCSDLIIDQFWAALDCTELHNARAG